ncbi:MAG: invasion associated locus B family protein [Pseudochelatococcus sp.]|uniref:invasion associated locus B family protein n=1 Tax=Pseudochelatococcus sp. TaxID=2020869 RepID=UPI003D9163A7
MSRVKQSAPLRAASGIAMALVAGMSALAPVATYAQTAPAQGQQQQPTGPTVVQLKAEPSQAEWTKVCGRDEGANKEICYTTRDFVSDQGQPVLAVAVYDVKGEPTKIARFLMPLGLLLRPGLRFFVDKNDPIAGQYAICFPNGCFAEAPVQDAFINSLKRGNILNISAQNQVGREVTFAVPLAGFTKGFDGKPIDPQALEQQQRQLQEALQKRSEELRQRAGQPGGAPAPAPAPAPAQ